MDKKSLYTAQELENILGKTYFYRQRIYRMAEDGKVSPYQVNGKLYFSSEELIKASLNRLANRIRLRFSKLASFLRINFDETKSKKITVYGFPDKSVVIADTENETEEELLQKVENKRREVKSMADIPVDPHDHGHNSPPPPHHPPHHPHHEDEIPPHEEILDVLRRIEDRLDRLEEKLG